jgi:hypothetical protein
VPKKKPDHGPLYGNHSSPLTTRRKFNVISKKAFKVFCMKKDNTNMQGTKIIIQLSLELSKSF